MEEPICPKCKGTGFVKKESGLLELCECRFKEEDINKALGIPKRFWHATLDNFELRTASERTAFAVCQYYVSSFGEKEGEGLTFVGNPGVGKTHLAVGVLKEIFLKKGVRGRFFDTKDLLYRLRSLIEEGKLSRAIKRILGLPLIVLDDLGSERLSDWQREVLSYIITYRYNNLKSTLITTNLFISDEDKEKALKEKKGDKLLMKMPKVTLAERLGWGIVSKINQMNKTVFMF